MRVSRVMENCPLGHAFKAANGVGAIGGDDHLRQRRPRLSRKRPVLHIQGRALDRVATVRDPPGGRRIRVHEIRPGLIQTDMTADVYEKYSSQVEAGELSAIHRWGQPDDIARAVATLAAGGLPFSTGDIYHIGVGMQIHRL
jgi:hypothetical protein